MVFFVKSRMTMVDVVFLRLPVKRGNEKKRKEKNHYHYDFIYAEKYIYRNSYILFEFILIIIADLKSGKETDSGSKTLWRTECITTSNRSTYMHI